MFCTRLAGIPEATSLFQRKIFSNGQDLPKANKLLFRVGTKNLQMPLPSKFFFSRRYFWFLMNYRTRANKGRGFYSKIIFSNLHNGVFYQFMFILSTLNCTKSQ